MTINCLPLPIRISRNLKIQILLTRQPVTVGSCKINNTHLKIFLYLFVHISIVTPTSNKMATPASNSILQQDSISAQYKTHVEAVELHFKKMFSKVSDMLNLLQGRPKL